MDGEKRIRQSGDSSRLARGMEQIWRSRRWAMRCRIWRREEDFAMRRHLNLSSCMMMSLFLGIAVIGAASLSLTAGVQGGSGTSAAQAAREKQAALEAATPQLQIT